MGKLRKWLLAMAKNWKISAPAVLVVLGFFYRIYSNWKRSQLADAESAQRKVDLKAANWADEEKAKAMREVLRAKEQSADALRERANQLKEEIKRKEEEHDSIVAKRVAIADAIKTKSHDADSIDALAKSLGL